MSDIAHNIDLQVAGQKKKPWRALVGTSQELALDSRADITFYHGARGPGKTDVQLMRFYRHVGKGYGPFWRGIIFDREYKNLDDLVSKSRRWFGGWDDGARFLQSSQDYKWVWETGEELLFRSVSKESDYWKYHGQEFPFIGWNELCKYPTPKLFDQLMSVNRTSFTPEKDNPNVQPLRLEVFATGNPYGPGHGWVKQRFIDPASNGNVVSTPTKIFDPKTQTRITVVKTQVAIFGSYRENPYLPAGYIADLENIRDPNVRKAWLLGSWDVIAGGALTDVWDRSTHVIPHFVVPHTWRIDRSFDWGSSHPSATIWWAEADGTEAVMRDGSVFCPPAGTLVAIGEVYTADPAQTNVGLRWGATRVAETIRDYEKYIMGEGLIKTQPYAGPADNQINDNRNDDDDNIATYMAKVGIRWTASDKSPGSRAIGLQLMRDRLEFAKQWRSTGEAPGPCLFFTTNCPRSIGTIPVLPRDEKKIDDVDTDAEDHLYDAARYRVLAGTNRWATKLKFSFAH